MSSIARAKLVCILDGPNDLGCALLAREHGAVPLSTALESGKIKGLISFEADIPSGMLAGLQILAAADWKSTDAVQAAGIVLPATTWVEMDGTYVNHEGRAQRFKKVMNPGLPIRGLDPARHPPRVHRHDAPGGDVLPAWAIIAGIIERLTDERIDEPLSGKWEQLRGLNAEGDGEIVL